MQALAVLVALRSAVALGGELGEAAERALRTVDRLMPARVAHQVARLAIDAAAPPGAVPVPTDVLLAVGAAVRDQQTLRFDHDPVDGPRVPRAPGARTAPPVAAPGSWYVVGWSPERADWRVHRVDRMWLRPPHGRRFERREVPGGDPVGFVEARFKGSDGADAWPCQGSAVLAAAAEAMAAYVGDGAVEALDGERCRLCTVSWSWEALAVRVLGHGCVISQAEPAELRDAFGRLVERAAAGAGQPSNLSC